MSNSKTIWSVFHQNFDENEAESNIDSHDPFPSSLTLNSVSELEEKVDCSKTEVEDSNFIRAANSSQILDSKTRNSESGDTNRPKRKKSQSVQDVPLLKSPFKYVEENKGEVLGCFSPLPRFQNLRTEIDSISDNCVATFLTEREDLCKIYTLQSKNNIVHSGILKKRLENLDLQNEEFGNFVGNIKTELIINSSVNDSSYAQSIFKTFLLEATIFKCFFPAYGLRQNILKKIDENQVIIISADDSYQFNVALHLLLCNRNDNGEIISCEKDTFSSQLLQKKIKAVLTLSDLSSFSSKVLCEDKLLNKFTCSESKRGSYIIINVSLKRSLTLDIILANFRNLLTVKKNLRLILLISPVDDSSKFESYFSPSISTSVLHPPSLCFPVKIIWKEALLFPEDNVQDNVVDTVFSIHVLCGPGDITVFVPSTEDINALIDKINFKINYHQYYEMKVFSSLDNPLDNSLDIPLTHVNSKSNRNVFLLTADSEGLSIPTVQYIIDCGMYKVYSFDPETDTNILAQNFISKARAKMRKCLAGTFNPGICFRLYNKENYLQNMPSKEKSEIFCLSPVYSLVQVIEYYRYKPDEIQFVESLPIDVLNSAFKALKTSGVIDTKFCLTNFGRQMVKLPVVSLPVKYFRLILFGIRWGFPYEAVILVAYFFEKNKLFVESVNEEHQKLIDAVKLNLNQFNSDMLSYLNIFKMWKENRSKKQWCTKNFLCPSTLRSIYRKVNDICCLIKENIAEEIKPEFSDNNDPNCLFQMLFESFMNNLCSYTGHHRTGYQILETKQYALVSPSSFLFERDYPRFVVYEKISGSQFLSNITPIPFEIVMEYHHKNMLNFSGAEMFNDQLEKKVIDSVGEKVINQVLLKNNGKRVTEIENEIKKETGAEVILLEPLLEKGCVYVYAFPNDIDKCVSSLNRILQNHMQAMLKEEEVKVIEYKKGQNSVRFETKMTKGAQTTISKHVPLSLNFQPSSKQDISTSALTSLDSKQTSINYTLKLEWPRRFCIGEGFLTVKNQNDFNQARKLALRSFQVNENKVFVQVNKGKPNQLHILEVPPDVTKEDLVKTFSIYLTCNFEIELSYNPPFNTTTSELIKIKKQIEDNCRNETNLLNFEVDVPMPSPTSLFMIAYVNVFETRCLDIEAKNLSSTKINQMKLKCTPYYFSILKCGVSIYKALQYRIRMELEAFTHGHITSGKKYFFKVYPSDDDTMHIKLISDDIEIIKCLQMKVNDILHGIILDKNNVSNIHKLFCHGGHVYLKNLESSTNTLIAQNFETKTIRLYGEEENCNYVRQNICYFLKDTEEREVMEKIILAKDKQNRTVLKALITQYGVKLEEFIEQCGLRSATLEIKTSSLILYGKKENIDKAVECIKELSVTNGPENVFCPTLSLEEICPVCFCPAENLTYRLEHCGHLYCSGCILSLIQEGNFPIQCCAENCYKDIILEDIKHVLNHDREKIDELAEKSLKAYLEKNHDKIFYCPAPDCSMFVFKNDLKEIKWHCPLCKNSICTKCNVVYHEGYSCEMYQGSKKDADYSFKVYQNNNKECKNCPNCSSAIEKKDGCNRMCCIICKTPFCWICLKKFKTYNEAYNHIDRAHPGQLFT